MFVHYPSENPEVMKSLVRIIARALVGITFFALFWILYQGEPDILGVLTLAIGFLSFYACLELAFFYYDTKHLPAHGKQSGVSGMNILPGESRHHQHQRLHHHHH